MTTASLAASDPGAAVRIDRLFFGLALAATATLVALSTSESAKRAPSSIPQLRMSKYSGEIP